MATCNVNTLLSDGKGFQTLESRGLTLAEAELISEWQAGGLDVNTLLARGVGFQSLDDRDLGIAKAQLLCEILGGI